MSGPRRLFLVRHAQAEGTHPMGDSARRLTPEGRDAFRERAAALAAEERITLVLTSPYARARQTAELLAAATAAPLEPEEAAASGRSSGQELVRIVRLRGPGTALVGHNPELADAVAFLAGREVPFPPGSIAALEFEPDGDWPRLLWVR